MQRRNFLKTFTAGAAVASALSLGSLPAFAADVGVSDGIKQALKMLS